MYFNGVNSYIQISDSPSIRLVNLSVLLWVQVFSCSRWNVIVSKSTALANEPNYEVGVALAYCVPYTWNGKTNAYGDYKIPLYIVHIGVTVSDSTTRFYVNGNLDKLSSWSVNTNYDTYPLFIGTDYPQPRQGDYYFFYGYITQVLIYSRALSDSEIQWNYQNPDNPVRDDLVLWLQADPAYVKDIDGDGIPEWIDLSGFNNHGKIYGAQLVQLIKTPARQLAPSRVLAPAR
jgi:hypothetical protein